MSHEVYIDVRDHPKHDADDEQTHNYCWKLVDTGDREQMVANCLREFGAMIRPEEGALRSDDSIFAALNRVRAGVMGDGNGPATRSLILKALDRVATELGLEWWGVRE